MLCTPLSQQAAIRLLARLGMMRLGSSEEFNAHMEGLGYSTRAIPGTVMSPALNRLHEEMHQRGAVTETDCEACRAIETLEV